MRLTVWHRRKSAYQVLHGNLTGLVDPFHELEYEVGITVNDGYANVVVVFVLLTMRSGGGTGGTSNIPSKSFLLSLMILLPGCSGSRTASTCYLPGRYQS